LNHYIYLIEIFRLGLSGINDLNYEGIGISMTESSYPSDSYPEISGSVLNVKYSMIIGGYDDSIYCNFVFVHD